MPAYQPGDRVIVTTTAGELPGVVRWVTTDPLIFGVRFVGVWGQGMPFPMIVLPDAVRPDTDHADTPHVVTG